MPYHFPAEFEPHEATWIAWPHHEPDWPGKLEPIPWVYAEIVRVLHEHERVEILCHDETVKESAARHLASHGVSGNYRLHLVPTERVWLRDSGPTGVIGDDKKVVLVNWRFNAWAKYDNFEDDARVGEAVQHITGLPRIEPRRPDDVFFNDTAATEIYTDGEGTLLVTEECLSPIQERIPDSRARIRARLRDALGIRQRSGSVKAASVTTRTDTSTTSRGSRAGRDRARVRGRPRRRRNHRRSVDNYERLQLAPGGAMRVVKLPYPRPVFMNGERLPASYANFYIANGVVIVPTFNDPNDRIALNVLAERFPDRRVVGIHAVDLVWGLGTLHCLTQQQPRA